MHELEAALCEVQISVGFTTPWDDLPLPGIAEADRSALRRRMPQPHPDRRRIGPRVRVVLAAFAVGLLSSGAVLSIDREPVSASASRFDAAMHAIADKTEAARVAGSRAYWAYPPPGQPDYPTALRMITQLEQDHGPLRQLALLRAIELRDEFAATLVRLGDQYWSAPNGRPFAVEFYAQAMLFDATLGRARDRASLSATQLADVAARVAVGEMSPIEVELAEALRALADADVVRRRERVAALLSNDSPLATSIRYREQLGAVVGILAVGSATPEAPPVADEPVPEPSLTGKPSGSSKPNPTGPTPSTTSTASTDPDAASRRAQSYVDKAESALAKGDRDRAERLFEKALAQVPKLAAAHAGLAEIEFARGHYQEAMTEAKRAVAARPKDATLQLLLGDACLKTLRYDDARRAYERAQALGHSKATQRLAQLAEVAK